MHYTKVDILKTSTENKTEKQPVSVQAGGVAKKAETCIARAKAHSTDINKKKAIEVQPDVNKS